MEQILKLGTFSLTLQIELVIFYEKRKQKQMCWSSAEAQLFGFPLLDMQLGEGEWESLWLLPHLL